MSEVLPEILFGASKAYVLCLHLTAVSLSLINRFFSCRAAQDEFIEEMSSTKPGNEWTKVARLCDFNPKVNKNTKDVSRMRSILLRLKQEPLVR